MSDYVNCPTCHGRGVIPLEEARRIEAHGQASRDAAASARYEAERAGLARDRELREMTPEQRADWAEQQIARLEGQS
jgi:hypothetical protein